ncbi:D-alanine aminotransferase [Caloramator mitchellensis]|uniref:D-alanine aminotransferase n=1 Tax=Caloramator mitchellensis TaxID=908809 RepID=A0A0R3JWG3_CALMK|nr:aminotransferase class IV [Caloramator mitchellensis]KRQ87402.1 D-alanine aminotransferase [Caloramator mitchellensis]
MGEAILNYFMHNGKIYETLLFNEIYKEVNPAIYEVIRIMNGKPLFFEEHFDRLRNSAWHLNRDLDINLEDSREKIYNLVTINEVMNNNIKIVINNLDDPNVYLYFIKSEYPTDEMYRLGVRTILYEAERKNPHAKVIYKDMREEINMKLKETGCYEALLMKKNGEITEGSRSNLFFIKGNKVFTAPTRDVLVGITRLKIMQLCREKDIEVVEMPIYVDSLEYFDAAFLTGTSPKVLPISHIGDLKFDVECGLLREIMKLYDEKIDKYMGTVH